MTTIGGGLTIAPAAHESITRDNLFSDWSNEAITWDKSLFLTWPNEAITLDKSLFLNWPNEVFLNWSDEVFLNWPNEAITKAIDPIISRPIWVRIHKVCKICQVV